MNRIPTLDGWRGIAILLVLAEHFIPHRTPYLVGTHGVNIFFVLSGYLITTKLREERAKQGGIDLKRFYVRRFFRLMPTAWLYLAFLAIAGRLYLREAFACVFFYRQFADFGASHWVTGHFWTLSVEEDFYLVWPIVLVLLGDWWAMILGIGFVAFIGSGAAPGSLLFMLNRFEFMPLLVGCLTAYLPRALTIPARLHKSLLAISIATLVLCASTIHQMYVPLSELIVIAFAVWSTGQGVSRFALLALNNKAISWLGVISYTLYVWHGMLVVPSGGFMWYPITRFAIPVLGASALYLAIERPCIRIGNRLISAKADVPRLPIFPDMQTESPR